MSAQTGFTLPLSTPHRFNLRGLIKTWRRKPLGIIGLVVIVVVVALAIAPSTFAPYDPYVRAGRATLAPSGQFWLGTDNSGRDILSRLIYGARISILVGCFAIAVGTTGGVAVGVVSGYVGGKLDLVLQRVMDAMLCIPALLLAMVIVMVLGSGTFNGVMAIAVVIIPSQNRVIRSAVLSIKQNDYVTASIALGASNLRIMTRHIFPNVVPIILVLVSSLIGAAIIVEASLSFLGLGTQPPTASWGNMLSGQARLFLEVAPWMALAPGVAISITVLAFNMVGDAVRDITDPRLRSR